jgi:carbamoyltransferase
VSDGVVARCAGRAEFGARALGNRSILANPSDFRVVSVINRMIKNRDFWMPFAPSVLRERESDYIVNPKGLASPYMMLAFATNPKRRDEITAAVHPHDGTARAHLVDEAWNPGYHRVIREFDGGPASGRCSTRPSIFTASRWSARHCRSTRSNVRACRTWRWVGS